MTRIKINARRIFSLLIPFFFFTSVHAEQTAAPATPVTVEAKNETFAPQHPDQYLSWKATSEQSERVDALAEDPRNMHRRHGLHCLMSVLSGFWRQSRRLAFLSWLKHGSI